MAAAIDHHSVDRDNELVIRPRSTSSSRRMRRRIGKAMALSLVALVMLVVAGQRIYRSQRAEQPIDETGVVTVISVLGGRSSKFGGSFDHHVRLDSGREGTMNFSEIFPRGARVWVSYSRYPESDRFRVKTYVRQGESRPGQEPDTAN